MSTGTRRRLLVFHPALAPYRVEQFNRLSDLFELRVVFLFDNVWNHPFDQSRLLSRARFAYGHLLSGLRWKGRVFRRGMLREIRNFRPDIVFGFEFSPTTIFLMLLARLYGMRFALGSTIDDSPEICRKVQSPVRALARRLLVRRLDHLAVLSTEVAEFYARAYGISPSRIVVSPLLQDPRALRADSDGLERTARAHVEFHGLDGRRVLLFVGRLIPEKGVVPFLERIAGILRDRPEFLFVVVGDGPERPALESLVANLGLERSVLLAGRFEGPELLAWYLCADGFALPSLFEPFGAVVDEAQAFGLPVLCSRLAGSASLVTPGKGTVFDPSDPVLATSRFLDGLPPSRPPLLALRPSLSSFDDREFAAQWGKLHP